MTKAWSIPKICERQTTSNEAKEVTFWSFEGNKDVTRKINFPSCFSQVWFSIVLIEQTVGGGYWGSQCCYHSLLPGGRQRWHVDSGGIVPAAAQLLFSLSQENSQTTSWDRSTCISSCLCLCHAVSCQVFPPFPFFLCLFLLFSVDY